MARVTLTVDVDLDELDGMFEEEFEDEDNCEDCGRACCICSCLECPECGYFNDPAEFDSEDFEEEYLYCMECGAELD